MPRGHNTDLTGRVFGNLTVLDNSMRGQRLNGRTHKYWLCQCTCGAKVWKLAHKLMAGEVRSCGFGHKYSDRWGNRG